MTTQFLLLLRHADTEMLEVLLNDLRKDLLLHRFMDSSRLMSERSTCSTLRLPRMFSDQMIHRMLLHEAAGDVRGRMRIPEMFAHSPMLKMLEFDPMLLRGAAQEAQVCEPRSLWEMPGWLLDDKHFVRMVLQIKSSTFARLRPFFIACVRGLLRESPEIAMLAVRSEPWCVAEFEPQLLHDSELLVVALHKSGGFLQFASAACQDDKDIVLLAVQQSGLALEFASDASRANRDIVLVAVQQDGKALQFAATELCADREIVSAALQQSALSLQFASTALRADHAVVSMAVCQMGVALQFAEHELQDDREVVSTALRQSGQALQHASIRLRGDRHLVLTAIYESAWAFDFATLELQADQGLLAAAICTAVSCDSQDMTFEDCLNRLNLIIQPPHGVVPSKIGPILWSCLLREQSVAAARVASSPKSYMQLDEAMQSNLEVALAAVTRDWTIFPCVPYQTRNDFAIQVAAAKQSATAYHFMLPTDRKRVMDAVEAFQESRPKIPRPAPANKSEVGEDQSLDCALPQ